MNSLLVVFRGSGAPPARLDNARFETFFGLDMSELLAFVALVFVAPLLFWGINLPEPFHLLAVAQFPLWALLLFFVGANEHNTAYWLSRMLPYWIRQHEFRSSRTTWRVTPRTERLDTIVLGGENAIVARWETGADGVPELHLYETNLRPYRAWVAAGGRPAAVGPHRGDL